MVKPKPAASRSRHPTKERLHPPYAEMGYSRRGADMGRIESIDTSPGFRPSRLHLRRVDLRDGYDPGGAYWGTPVYSGTDASGFVWCAWSRDHKTVLYVRAWSRDSAKKVIQDRLPGVTLAYFR